LPPTADDARRKPPGRLMCMATGILRGFVAMAVPLALWRLALPLTGWAALALLPLGIAIWWGIYLPLRDRRRAELAVAILPGARLGRWLTGRFGAGLNATLGLLVALPVLGWLALGGQAPVIMAVAAVGLMAGILSTLTTRLLSTTLTDPYARLAGQRIGSVVAALAGLVPLVWINWAVIPIPNEITSASLADAVSAALAARPARDGWPAEVMGLFAALDTAKLWLAAQYRRTVWVGLVFSIDAALVSFVAARSSVAVLEFTRSITGSRA